MTKWSFWITTGVYGLLLFGCGLYFLNALIFENLTVEKIIGNLVSGKFERLDILMSLFFGLVGLLGLAQMIGKIFQKKSN